MVTPNLPLRWGRIFTLLLVSLAVVEAASRVGLYLWAGRSYGTLSAYLWSPYGLVRNNPALTSPSFVINENGFRNTRPFTRAKPPRTLRVMILGGSVMYSGLGGVRDASSGRVGSDETIAPYLERQLRDDPALAGLQVEVINAAVNFNRIVEVTTCYVAEYAMWEPDILIVGGSANNFSYLLRKGSFARRETGFQEPHGWEVDFQRMANDRGVLSLAERAVLTLEQYLASVALSRKLMTTALDQSFSAVKRFAPPVHASGPVVPGPLAPPASDVADWDEYDRYVNEYLGYAAAIIATARQHDQQVAFFWEYLLGNIGDMKPLAPVEQRLYARNRRSTYRIDREFDFRGRDRVAAFCRAHGAAFLDPLDRLRTHAGQVFIDYLHYSREGNEFMARFMYDQLRPQIHQRAARIRMASGSALMVTQRDSR